MTDEPVGSLAEEAAKLFGALNDAQRAEGGHSAERCPHTWCPVCHIAEYLHDHPELIRQVTDSAAAFMASVREVLDQFEEDGE